MSPISKLRRTTRATYEGHGIVVGRFGEAQLAETDPRATALLTLRELANRAGRAGSDEPAPLAVDTAVAEAALVLVALGASSRAAGHERRAVQRAKSYLRERLAERIRLDDVADHVGLDKYHLIRAFRAQVGAPPYEYLTHARVHRARELLRAGVPAGAAATAVGFCDQSQLHRHFVRLVGMTPGRYAASARAWRTWISIGIDPGPGPGPGPGFATRAALAARSAPA